MTGATFTVEFDALAARERIGVLMDRMENPQPFLQAVGLGLVESTKRRFDQGVAPDGSAWAPHAPSTIRQRIKSGKVPLKILVSDGLLRGSIITQVEGQSVRVGSNAVGDQSAYAAIHQFGGSINRPARTGRAFGRQNVAIPAHTITMPARPYLGVSADDEADILELADLWLGQE